MPTEIWIRETDYLIQIYINLIITLPLQTIKELNLSHELKFF